MKNLAKLLLFPLLLTVAGYCQSIATGNITAAGTTCSTAGACIVALINQNTGGAMIQLSGTFTGTVQFESSIDNVTWVAINGTPLNSTTGASSATSAGIWQFNVAGASYLRARASAYSAGPILVAISPSTASARSGGGGGGGGAVSSVTGAGTVTCSPTTGDVTCTGSGGAGHVYWNPAVCVAQGAGISLGGSFPTSTYPVATLTTAGTTTAPVVCGGAFSFTNRGTGQWIEWRKANEAANPSGKLTVNFYTDAATSGNVIWDGVLACGATTTTNQPTYGSVQTLATVVPSAINTIYSATLSNFNITCAAGSSMWLRVYLDSTTTSTGNILLTDVQWTEQ